MRIEFTPTRKQPNAMNLSGGNAEWAPGKLTGVINTDSETSDASDVPTQGTQPKQGLVRFVGKDLFPIFLKIGP